MCLLRAQAYLMWGSVVSEQICWKTCVSKDDVETGYAKEKY